ncbi:hypothetical protein H4R34_003167 [Dimargaris verticillata]|uniref:CSC1/OSCA1-like 7TM region domain-containing protein n=1 Tax=Dimargaris verticillata TaxID=2761393 RepID=A0A9W8B1C3_9FUNG|nr:hypothetical protein H4R34_003167 [Dimargaris verticillata]
MPSLVPRVDVGDILGLGNGTGTASVPGSTPAQAQHTPSLTTQLIFAVAMGGTLFLLFCLLRFRWPTVYAPRSRLRRVAPIKLPKRLLGWLLPVINTSEMFMLQTVGLDAVMFLRFFKVSIAIFSVLAVPGLAVLLPLNVVGSDYASHSYLSMNSMPDSSPLLAVHLVFVYLFSMVVYYYLMRYTYHYLALRWHYLLRNAGSVESRSVMVINIPGYLQDPAKLRQFFDELDIGQIEATSIIGQLPDLPALVKARAECLRQLETHVCHLIGNPCVAPDYDRERLRQLMLSADLAAAQEERDLLARWMKPKYQRRLKKNPAYDPRPTVRLPSDRWFRLGPKVDAIDHYKEKFLEYDRVVKTLRRVRSTTPNADAHGNPMPTDSGSAASSSVGFVTFTNSTSAHIAAQTLTHAKPFACITVLAPEPANVYWNNLTARFHSRVPRTIMVFIAMVALTFFWGIPVAFLSSLLSLETLGEHWEFVKNLAESSPVFQSLFTNTLPSVVMISYFNLLPAIVQKLTEFKGIRVRADMDIFVLSRVFFFQVFNVLLVFTLSGTLWNSLFDIFEDPSELTTKLAASLPQVGPFFINYVIVLGIAYLPFKLLQVLPMIWTAFRRYLCTTPRDFAEVVAPIYVAWGARYPVPMLVFVLTLTYSNISPLILVFGVLYFVLGFVFYKYVFLYVYFKYYESSGRMWPYVVRRLVVAMYLYHLLMFGYFSLKGVWVVAILTIPTVAMNSIFFHYLNKILNEFGEHVPLSLLRLHQRRREELLTLSKLSALPLNLSTPATSRPASVPSTAPSEEVANPPQTQPTAQPPVGLAANAHQSCDARCLHTANPREGEPCNDSDATGSSTAVWEEMAQASETRLSQSRDDFYLQLSSTPLSVRRRSSLATLPLHSWSVAAEDQLTHEAGHLKSSPVVPDSPQASIKPAAASLENIRAPDRSEASESSPPLLPNFDDEQRPAQLDFGYEDFQEYSYRLVFRRLWRKIVDHFAHALPSYFINMTDLERVRWLETMIETEDNALAATLGGPFLGHSVPRPPKHGTSNDHNSGPWTNMPQIKVSSPASSECGSQRRSTAPQASLGADNSLGLSHLHGPPELRIDTAVPKFTTLPRSPRTGGGSPDAAARSPFKRLLSRSNSLPHGSKRSLRRRLTHGKLTPQAAAFGLRQHASEENLPSTPLASMADSPEPWTALPLSPQVARHRSASNRHRRRLRYLSGPTAPSTSIMFLHPDVVIPYPENSPEKDSELLEGKPNSPLGARGSPMSAPTSPMGPAFPGSSRSSLSLSRRSSTNDKRPLYPLGIKFIPSNHPYSRRYLLDAQNLDQDQFDLLPDKYTDYSQSPMELVHGILDSGIKFYQHPSIVGELPELWLPSGKGEFEKLVQARLPLKPVRYLKARIRRTRLSLRSRDQSRSDRRQATTDAQALVGEHTPDQVAVTIDPDPLPPFGPAMSPQLHHDPSPGTPLDPLPNSATSPLVASLAVNPRSHSELRDPPTPAPLVTSSSRRLGSMSSTGEGRVVYTPVATTDTEDADTASNAPGTIDYDLDPFAVRHHLQYLRPPQSPPPMATAAHLQPGPLLSRRASQLFQDDVLGE